jgi:hypothetical protein
MAIWNIWQPFGISKGHLVNFVVILVYFSRFGTLYQEKSGNPGPTWIQSLTDSSFFCAARIEALWTIVGVTRLGEFSLFGRFFTLGRF